MVASEVLLDGPGLQRLGQRYQLSPYPHWAILTASSLLILLALSFLWLHLITPSDGARLQPGSNAINDRGLVVTALGETDTGLRSGDLVVAVDGRSMESWARSLFASGLERPRWSAGDVVDYSVVRNGVPVELAVELQGYPLAAVAKRNWGTILFALIFLPIAAFVYARRPQNPATQVLFLSAAALLAATTWSLGAQASDFLDPVGFWLFQLTTIAAFMTYWTSCFHFALVFPRPLAITRRAWLLPAIYLVPLILETAYLAAGRRAAQSTLEWLSGWGSTVNYHASLFLGLALMAALWQYRTHRRGAAREQIRWIIFASLITGTAGLSLYLLPPLFGAQPIHPNFIGVIVVVYPVAIAIAVLRHNLFDIDSLLNRTLVYGALSAVIVMLYVAVVGTLGSLLQARGDLFVSLVATGLVAVLFQPLRERLQQVINRVMYGERDSPHMVLSRLGERLESSGAPHAVLPTLVQTIAQTLKLPYVALVLGEEPSGQKVVSYGRSRQPASPFPLVYRGESLGKLLLEPRAPDEPFAPAELQLIATISRQAGVAAYAVRVTEDLQRSRERLVSTREEERRRLRRDLHDGLGPALAAVTLKLDAARNVLNRNPGEVEPMLVSLHGQVQDVIADLRRLVYALRPPALDELGLVAALREQGAHYRQQGLAVDIEAPEPMPALPAAVEVAAFRIVQEAMTNVLRHAGASRCQVALTTGQALGIVVSDDGKGVPEGFKAGVGLTSMRERVAELGGKLSIAARHRGGTLLTAELPLGERL